VSGCRIKAAAPIADQESIWLAARGRLHRFTDAGPQGVIERRFMPRITWYTGDIDAHDVGVDEEGPLVVATAFNAIVRPSARRSFVPTWWPPFLDGAMQGDRCHLNGLAVHQGKAVAATLIAATDQLHGWRTRRLDGGQLLSIPDGRVLASGLCMPHSPRVHQGDIWLHEAGLGRLVRVSDRGVEPIIDLPGFSRGLALLDRFAVVGVSAPRTSPELGALPFTRRMRRQRQSPMCGMLVVDTVERRIIAGLRIEGTLIHELYDVAILRDTRTVSLVGFRGDDRFTTLDLQPSAPDR